LPTRNGIAFFCLTALLLVAGIVLHYTPIVLVASGMIACLVVALIWLWLRPDLQVRRQVVPARVTEGESANGVLHVTNSGKRRCPPLVATESTPKGYLGIPLPGLHSGATFDTTYRIPTERRGCYKIGPLQVGYADPLRLINVSKSDGYESLLWVHPRIHKVKPIPTSYSQEAEGPTSLGAPRGGITFHSLRDYVPGDDPRLIHWRSTARTGHLMVRHTVVTNEPRLMIVLDTSARSYLRDSFEDAVRVAASLIMAGADQRFPTDFRTTGGISGSIDPAGTGRIDVLDKLASVKVSDDDPGLRALIRIATVRDRGMSLGVVTGRPSRERMKGLAAVRNRFQTVTVVQIGEASGGRAPIALSGVLGVNATTSEQWAHRWKAIVG
jgi:uncharacterized protein (DUF58 family)